MTEKRGKILSFANPKGGVGKSTISCLVTAMLKWTDNYNSVQLIDADKQGSSIRLLQRISSNIPCSHYPISYEYDKLNVLLLEQLMHNCRMQKGNVLVIDTPARPDQEGIELLTKSHAIIIPCSNTLAELPITLDFVKKIDDLKARIKKIHPHIVVIPNKIHLNRKHIDDFIKYFDNHDVVIGPPIHDSAFIRKVYTKQYDYNKISQETIFTDLNNVVSFLKKYVIDEQLDEIYKSENTVRKENISSISK